MGGDQERKEAGAAVRLTRLRGAEQDEAIRGNQDLWFPATALVEAAGNEPSWAAGALAVVGGDFRRGAQGRFGDEFRRRAGRQGAVGSVAADSTVVATARHATIARAAQVAEPAAMQAAEQLVSTTPAGLGAATCAAAGAATHVEGRSQLVLPMVQRAGVAAVAAMATTAAVAHRSTGRTTAMMSAASEEVTMKVTVSATAGSLAVAIPQMIDARRRVVAAAGPEDVPRVDVLVVPRGRGDRGAGSVAAVANHAAAPLPDVDASDRGPERGTVTSRRRNRQRRVRLLPHAVHPRMSGRKDRGPRGATPRLCSQGFGGARSVRETRHSDQRGRRGENPDSHIRSSSKFEICRGGCGWDSIKRLRFSGGQTRQPDGNKTPPPTLRREQLRRKRVEAESSEISPSRWLPCGGRKPCVLANFLWSSAHSISRAKSALFSSILGCMNLAALATIDNQSEYARAALAMAATLPAAVILLRAWWTVRESTLVIPWAWSVGCFALVAATSTYAALVPASERGTSFVAMQFAAASGTLCPIVALVGAKRPQHSAWSFVVLALWLVLALPAAEVICLHPGQQLEINSIRSWFLWGLLAAELSAFVLTRYSLSMLLLVSGQIVWLSEWLPLLPRFSSLAELREVTGLVLATSAVVGAWVISLRPARTSNQLDRLWFDFRDSFGLFWALKLAERVNDAGKQAGWDFDLGWGGFRTKADFAPLDQLSPETATALRNSLQGLLRRFVSAEWISERLDAGVDLAATNELHHVERKP